MDVPEIRQCRKIRGISALLLPFNPDHSVDWTGFEAILKRTLEAGLVPAVNMDTGSTQFIDRADRAEVLRVTASHCDEFVAGCFVSDKQGAVFDERQYQTEIEKVCASGGLPILFPSWGLNSLPEEELVPALDSVTVDCDAFLGFELGAQFVPYGRIYTLDTYCDLLSLSRCVGAKHSSLSRELEWQRLQLRDQKRPDFNVYTGNDLAIDMVVWGSDYLLGLSTFAPEKFAERDRLWESGDTGFYLLNDKLQYLGAFAFRAPVPGYKHNAAQLLKLQGVIGSDVCPPGTPERPSTDSDVLRTWLEDL